MFRTNGLGMELHTQARVLTVSQRHNSAIGGLRERFERGIFKFVYCKGMVAHGRERRWDMFKQWMTIVGYLAGFSMQGICSMHQPGAKIHTQCLVAKAYTEYGNALVKMINDSHGDARL